MDVETLIEDDRWQDVGHGVALATLAGRACGAVMRHFRLRPDLYEISLMGCDDARIAALNGDFRDKPTPTNVLSWPTEERSPARPGQRPRLPFGDPDGMPVELGDIAIAWETCAREAAAAGLPLEDHVTHLIVHATLHLLGYDHINDTDAALMQRIETEILGNLGISDPYGEA